jgi:3-(3-hydroxy-phenyl)propionate hydroxylase
LLKLVLEGKAPQRLLDSYNEERVFAADDNLKISSGSTDFMTPKSTVSKAFRDSVLDLARDYEFARPLVNSGRLSTPTPYLSSSLNTPDTNEFLGSMAPGTSCADAPVRVNGEDDWFLHSIGGRFIALTFDTDPGVSTFDAQGIDCDVLVVGKDIDDSKGRLRERYDGQPGTTYLIRPDQYVIGRWRSFDQGNIEAALNRATCRL